MTLFNVTLWIFLNALPTFYIIHASKYLNKLDDESKKRFSAFRRLDLDKFSYLSACVLNIFFLPRFFAAWIIVFVFMIFVLIVMIGTSHDRPIGKVRENIVYYLIKPAARLHMFMCGVIWADWSIKHDVDYSYYLGPDWKPTYTGAGI
jgi:hypothetical protein